MNALVPVTTPSRPTANPVAVYLASLTSPGSRRTQRTSLKLLARLLVPGQPDITPEQVPWQQVRLPHAKALRSALEAAYAPKTANLRLAALRGVLRACWELDLMSAEDYHKAKSVRDVRGVRLPAGRAASRAELAALLDACGRDASARGRRDAALLALLYGCGLREAEAVALRLEHYDAQTHALKVMGKGRKERLAYVADLGAQAALGDWLAVRGHADGPLFAQVRSNGSISAGTALSTTAVRRTLTRRYRQARIAHLSPHDLRRTFAGDLLDAGADIVTVQRLMGHASVQTTAGYDRRGERAKERAAGLVSVPYTRRGA